MNITLITTIEIKKLRKKEWNEINITRNNLGYLPIDEMEYDLAAIHLVQDHMESVKEKVQTYNPFVTVTK